MLYLLSSIKETSNFPFENPMGIIYMFTRAGIYGFFGNYTSINEILLFICIFVSIWGGIRIIALNGNLGDILISSFLLGLLYGFLDTLSYLIYLIELHNITDEEEPFEFSVYQDMLLTYWLYFTVISITTALIFGGIYSEIVNMDKAGKSLNPKNIH
jgi:hypothetical protein